MDDIKETTQKLQKSGIIQHVFNFDETTKKYLMNTTQYSITVLPLAILVNKLLEDFVSEFDDTKGNFEILAEVILQFVSINVSVFIIHRVATYLPTYSGTQYENINLFSIIIALGFLLYYSQSSFGLKIKLLGERMGELWNGPPEEKNGVNVTSKLNSNDGSGQQNNMNVLSPPMPTNNGSRADYLMSHDQMTAPVQQQQQNNMGQNDPYGSTNDQFSGIINEPQAANGVLGSVW